MYPAALRQFPPFWYNIVMEILLSHGLRRKYSIVPHKKIKIDETWGTFSVIEMVASNYIHPFIILEYIFLVIITIKIWLYIYYH